MTRLVFKSNVLFENKKIKLWKKWNSVEHKADIMQHVLQMQQLTLLP